MCFLVVGSVMWFAGVWYLVPWASWGCRWGGWLVPVFCVGLVLVSVVSADLLYCRFCW